MRVLSHLVFQVVRWAARRGLREDAEDSAAEKKHEARRTGVRGETYAYWYLRRLGYVFVARNYMPRGAKGEIDLIGYDGATLAFVEVRTRTVREQLSALPELSVTTDKQRLVVRTAQRFLAERHVGECPCRFDVMAIDNRPEWHLRCGCTKTPLVLSCNRILAQLVHSGTRRGTIESHQVLIPLWSPSTSRRLALAELRKDPITGRWVIISTERGKRPMEFLRESVKANGPKNCPFCPGAEGKTPPEILVYGRNGGGANTPGWKIRVVPNRFPALGIEGDLDREGEGLFDKMNGVGAHEVIIETPEHAATLATLPERAVEDTLWAYRDRMLDLKNDKRFRYVLIFKNHGEAAGASIEHPHSQLIALPIVPRRVREEVDSCWHYYDEKERCIFCDIIRQERDTGERVIGENEHFISVAPYAPRFPFEMWLLPKVHGSSFENNQSSMYSSLARLLKDMLMRLDAVLDCPAYNFMIHTSPIGEEINDHYHWHIEIIPKLTKVAGFEWGTGFYINPTPPEEAARFLREARIAAPAPAEKK